MSTYEQHAPVSELVKSWIEEIPLARSGPSQTTQPSQNPSAPALLDAAARHMRDRASTYDKPAGERSMGAVVSAFNAVAGRDLRESEGWLLLTLLKMVRSEQRESAHMDSIEDLVAYGSLYGEARAAGR